MRRTFPSLFHPTVFMATVAIVSACGGPQGGGPVDDATELKNVPITIQLPTGSTAGARLAGEAQRLAGGFTSALAPASFTDVARIVIDIRNVTTGGVVTRNVELERGAADGIWSTTVPTLPRNVQLEFVAHAFDSGAVELFNGVIQQTLTNPSNNRVTIGLTPADNNATLAIPRITRISVPLNVASGGSGSVTVAVEGSSGATLRFRVLPAAGGGEVFPASGQITLAGVSGSIVFQYVAPVTTSDSTFEHTIEIENARGTAVQANFNTLVLRRGSTDQVRNTEFRVQFSPIINNLVGRRIPDTGDVQWSAQVSDDNPTDQNQLTYQWAFLPDATYDPVPAFEGQARSSVLRNYATTISGTIRLRVTDADNGTTTLNWVLPANQFLDSDDLIVDVQNAGGVTNVTAGQTHSCALLASGGVRCWGRSNYGQLGYSNTTTYGNAANTLPYVAGSIPNIGIATQIATGAEHSCALFNDGQVSCWGRNDFGQLGYNTTQHVGDTEAVASYGWVNFGGNAARISTGAYHTCVVTDEGRVSCWGRNNYGQLGYGNNTNRNANIGDDEQPYRPGFVDLGGAIARDVVAGWEHTCVILDTGNVRCWGRNSEGQLGYGRNDHIGDNEIPLATNVNVGGTVRQLAAGQYHTCALLTNGAVRCWGYNSNGQLGINQATNFVWGDSANETPAALVANFGDVSFGAGRTALQISAGQVYTCATLDTGVVRCWGYNGNGELGLGNVTQTGAPSGDVRLGASAVRLESGSNHSCALLTTGRVRCWGYNGYGQLGLGHTNNIGDNEQVDGAGTVSILAP